MGYSEDTIDHTEDKPDVSFRDFLLKLSDWFSFLWKRKWIIILFGVIGAGLGLTAALIKAKEYEAQLSFVLEDSNAGGLGAYAGFASQFGLDITGGASSGLFSGDNIIEFLKSRLMVEKTLLSPVKDGGKVKSLVDLFIESYELNKGWAKYPKLVSLHYPPGADRKSFTLEQDSILGVIFTTLLNDNLEVFKPDKKLSFVTAKCVSKNEVFSKFFVERLVTEATDFYVATKIKRSKTNVDKLQLTADSIELLLNKKTYAIAVKQDINMNPARQVASVATEVASRDKIVLQTMYTEVIKNLELSRMSMAQETPIIQIVDSPILPLKVKKLGKAKGIVLGGIIGGFLICVVLILRRLFKSIMLR